MVKETSTMVGVFLIENYTERCYFIIETNEWKLWEK